MTAPFDAVALRYVHDTRTGEFLNIGVVLLAPQAGFAGCRLLDSWTRITAAFPEADVVAIRRAMKAIERVVAEWSATKDELQLWKPIATATKLVGRAIVGDDASLQLSEPLSGITKNAQRTLVELFELYAGKQQSTERRPTRDDNDVWQQFAPMLDEPVLRRVQREHKVQAQHLELVFDNSWKNGRWNVLQPLSFDLNEPKAIVTKATKWLGSIVGVKSAIEDTGVYFLVGLPSRESSHAVRTAANDAVALLTESLKQSAEVFTEDNRDKLASKIISDVTNHRE